MKKVLYTILASSMFLASCSSVNMYGGSVTINGTAYEWKAETETENQLIIDCINDIMNGSQSLNDNVDYYLNSSMVDSQDVIDVFKNVYNAMEEWKGTEKGSIPFLPIGWKALYINEFWENAKSF